VGFPAPPLRYYSLEQEVADLHQQELDWWDEEYERKVGALPPFSRLLAIRAVKQNVSIIDVMKQHQFYGMCMCGCGQQNPKYSSGDMYLKGHHRNRRVPPG
jgi:hypothetical protein